MTKRQYNIKFARQPLFEVNSTLIDPQQTTVLAARDVGSSVPEYFRGFSCIAGYDYICTVQQRFLVAITFEI